MTGAAMDFANTGTGLSNGQLAGTSYISSDMVSDYNLALSGMVNYLPYGSAQQYLEEQAQSELDQMDDAIDAFTLAFTELPNNTGVFFTRGGKIEFDPDDSTEDPITFESNLIEITEALASYLNEGVNWKMWIMKKDKIWWTHLEKPYLLN